MSIDSVGGPQPPIGVSTTPMPAADSSKSPVLGWSVMLPSGWWPIRLNDQRSLQVEKLLDSLLEAQPRDQVFRFREQLARQLNALLDEALTNGSTDVYLLADLRYGLPLAATCVITPCDVELPTGAPAEVLALLLANDAEETGVVAVDGRDCPVIVHRIQAEPDINLDLAETDVRAAAKSFTTTRLDVYVPYPDRPQTLLLSFSTPIAPVAEELCALFAAIASSLRWRREQR